MGRDELVWPALSRALDHLNMDAIRTLDTDKTAFFNHRDPEWVEKLSTRKLDI
jgi:hypothetical protein